MRARNSFRADLYGYVQTKKAGHITLSGRSYAGEVVVADIGITTNIFERNKSVACCYDQRGILGFLPERRKRVHIGNIWKTLVIAGSEGMKQRSLF